MKWFSPQPRVTHRPLIVLALLVALWPLAGCAPEPPSSIAVDYAPLQRDDWVVSTPAAEGLDPQLLRDLYAQAAGTTTTQAVLVVKNGKLIGEAYFGDGSVANQSRVQSVTKSITSALVGIALEKGCLSSVDQPMMSLFPELSTHITDPRKNEITLRQMLQMRAGYPWEESSEELFKMLYGGFRPSYLNTVPLSYDPGSKMAYSNLTSHLIGVMVARACQTDLRTFAQENLFDPLGVEMGDWIQDWEGNYNGHADLHLTARDMARFGQLYLDRGAFNGQQLVPSSWVQDSLQTYTRRAWKYRVGPNYRDMGYGYQWWTVRAGKHRFVTAWGHGGQQIALLEDFDMVIVVKADPLFGQHGDEPWKREKENLNLVGDFVASLPAK